MTIIKNARVSMLHASLNQPFRIAVGQHDSLDNVLLTLELSDGKKGYGEAAVATHITGETIPQTVKNLKTIAVYLQGKDIGAYLDHCAHARAVVGTNQAALAAVEMALFDALTRHLRMPMWRMWGNKAQPLRTDITIVIASLDETIEKTKAFYRQGFRAFKIKIGRNPDEDIARIRAVAQLAPKSQIILDANQGYSAKQTLDVLKELARVRVHIDLIEQPVPKADWEGLKRVTRSTKVLVCADESAGSLPDAVRLIKEKAVGAINIKFMKTGIIHAATIAALAQANGVRLMIGGMMESSLAMTASAHLASGMGGFDFIDLDTPFFIKHGLKHNPYLSVRGAYNLNAVNEGIGICKW